MKRGKKNEQLRQLIDIQYELYVYIVSLTGGTHDAEDVLQNTNRRIVELLEDLADGEIKAFRAWARKVAFFQVMTWRKSAKRERVLFDSALIEAVAEQLERREAGTDARMTALEACLKKLPGALRRLIDKRYQGGTGVKQIAAVVGTTPHAVTMNLYRTRLMLKACIEEALTRGEGYA